MKRSGLLLADAAINLALLLALISAAEGLSRRHSRRRRSAGK